MASASSSWPESTTTGTFGRMFHARGERFPRRGYRAGSGRAARRTAFLRERGEPIGKPVDAIHLTGDLPSTRRKRTRSASPGLSSISNTFVVWVIHSFYSPRGGRLTKPNQNSSIDFTVEKKSFRVSRLADVAIRAQFVAAGNVLAQLRSAEDHDRNAAQVGTCLHRRQHRQAISLGQIQVEDDQIGVGSIGKVSAAVQKRQSLGAVALRC